jgi:hypothetical protein
MADVLTTAHVVKCFHGFDIKFNSTTVTQVDGASVVRMTDLTPPTAVISCTDPQTKCTTITATASTTLFDGTAAVAVVTGLTTDRGTCTVTAPATILLTAE